MYVRERERERERELAIVYGKRTVCSEVTKARGKTVRKTITAQLCGGWKMATVLLCYCDLR